MNILVIASVVGTSPSEQLYSFVFDEVTRLAKQGLSVSIARLRLNGTVRAYCVDFYDIDAFRFLTLPLGLRKLAYYPLHALNSPLHLLGLELLYSEHIEGLVKKLNPNLLHAHFAHFEGWSALLAKLGMSKKYLSLSRYTVMI